MKQRTEQTNVLTDAQTVTAQKSKKTSSSDWRDEHLTSPGSQPLAGKTKKTLQQRVERIKSDRIRAGASHWLKQKWHLCLDSPSENNTCENNTIRLIHTYLFLQSTFQVNKQTKRWMNGQAHLRIDGHLQVSSSWSHLIIFCLGLQAKALLTDCTLVQMAKCT